MRIAFAAFALLPAVVLAGSALDGTWKMRPNSVKVSGKPDSRVIEGGAYSCSSCVPAIDKLPADGAYHKVAGHAYYDEMKVTILSPTAIEIATQRDGKPASVTSYTLSADGNTANGKFTDYSGSAPATGMFTEKRVGPAPAGAHATSGAWLPQAVSSANDALSIVVYAMTADGFSMKANGQSYEAKFDGKQYPVTGDPGGTKVTLKKIDDHTVQESDYRQGKEVDEIHLAASGNALELTDKDLVHGQTTNMTFDKQP
jgi:hypothetical protein